MAIFNDALSDFTQQMSFAAGGAYRDAPYASTGHAGLEAFYKQSWIAKAVVERIPEDCFKKGYVWVAEPDQINAIEALERRLKIKEKKKKALMLARLDGEAYIYFDLGDDAEEPVRAVGRDKLRFVNVLRKTEVAKGPVINDPMSEWYGQPEWYEVAGATAMVRIHPSRICRFVRNADPSSGEGTSDLVAVMPTIVAAETARDNVVALTTEARIDVMKVAGLMDAVQDPHAEAQIVKRYALARTLKATNKMLVIDKEGEEYEQKHGQFGTLPEVIETMRREVAAAAEIPYALLFGREGGLGTNGETEMATYYDAVATIQETDIQQPCEALDEAIIQSALGSRPAEIYLKWVSLWQLTDKEKAEVAKIVAETARTLVDGGIVPVDVITEPVVNEMAEIGALPGIEQAFKDWVAGGGDLDGLEEADSVTP